MSHLFLHNLIIEAKHGIHPHEKEHAQRFNISLDLEVTTPQAYASDNINDTVSYSWLRQTVIEIVEHNSFDLIEHLAKVTSESILVDERINNVTITIKKLDVYPSGVPGVSITYPESLL
jgi:dihydroneopterin aldolase